MTTYTKTGGPVATGTRWLTAAVPVAAVAWGTNQFIPMLIVYRGALALSVATVQAVFGLYAAGLVPGLLAGGPLSDRYGRRRLMVTALLMSAAAAGLLLAAHGVGLLFAGRLLTGLAAGIAFSTGAAWLRELSAPASAASPARPPAATLGATGPVRPPAATPGATGPVRPPAATPGAPSPARPSAASLGAPGPVRPPVANPGPRRATVAMCVGFSGGPLAAGLLAAFAPAPTVTPYVPQLVLVLAGLVLTTRAPGGGASGPGRFAVGIPAAGVGRFVRVIVPVALWVFTTATVAMAYLPVLVAGPGTAPSSARRRPAG